MISGAASVTRLLSGDTLFVGAKRIGHVKKSFSWKKTPSNYRGKTSLGGTPSCEVEGLGQVAKLLVTDVEARLPRDFGAENAR